jgi:hypothetical protein
MIEFTKRAPLPTASARVYTLRGITYLPHYSKPSYVGLGYGFVRDRECTEAQMYHATKEFSIEELLLAGAVPEQKVLWLGVDNSTSLRVCLETKE